EILPFSYNGWIETHQVRHGKEMTFAPIGSANMILRLAAGQQWWVGGSIETGDRTIPPGVVEKFIGIHLGGVQTWFLLSRTKTDGSTVGFSELEASVTEQGDRITALEGAGSGVTTFSGLTDTPNGYHPGKMLSYNLAGDAIVPVDPINNFRGLTDTPSDYSGQSSKAIVVKGDESGLEFASMPNLAPLQSEVNNLHNDLIGVNNNIYVQGQKITTAEGKIEVLEGFTDGQGSTYSKNGGNVVNSEFANRYIESTGGTYNHSFNLPKIVPVGYPPAAAECYHGRTIYLVNSSPSTKNVKPNLEDRFQIAGVRVEGNKKLPPNTTVKMLAQIDSDGVGVWIPVGTFTTNGLTN
ncbi:MAG: hypothetical protein ACRDCE_02430, partial [Cetobacterium sp.]|uniref:hypothetical protein n=1 Tax=Cetobacterium sp. TaxID=2071632 RepID=UPI003EE79EAB